MGEVEATRAPLSLAPTHIVNPCLLAPLGTFALRERPRRLVTPSGYLTTRPADAAGLPAKVVIVPRVPSVVMGQLLID
jgi:hypothetical protein